MGKCEKIEPNQVNSNDVYYTGPYLPTLDIETNSNITLALQAIEAWAASFTGGSSDYIIKGGTNNQTADGLTLVFTIPHTLGQVPTSAFVAPKNQNTTSNFSYTTDLTNITITYPVAPSQNTSLSWFWQVTKI